jgi:hypothetical protein
MYTFVIRFLLDYFLGIDAKTDTEVDLQIVTIEYLYQSLMRTERRWRFSKTVQRS